MGGKEEVDLGEEEVSRPTTTMNMDDSSVRVALRVRPQIAREKAEKSAICTSVTPGEPQILMGNDKAFTYDFVFDMGATQEAVYSDSVSGLIEGTFEGYNATVFAYGQTGSGKTYSMGTGFDLTLSQEELGIVPRAMYHLFQGIKKRKEESIEAGKTEPEFKIQVQFIELYNEEIFDLLDANGRNSEGANRKSAIRIHEDSQGGIYMAGVNSVSVASADETLQTLKNGALGRTTASTNMNSQSSRSHAIFSVIIQQQRLTKFRTSAGDISPDSALSSSGEARNSPPDGGLPEFEMLTAKFHFVDLAGSERLKRTGATGDRAKEGISINCGLLSLGNVISALGDPTKRATHVPYRDSKLTRLLQDSLGGNSRTLMIACISPSDCDFVETLNTLKYANRARNIKNKVVVNQDKTTRMITELRTEITSLKQELLDYKTGKRMISEDGSETVNDMFHENVLLQSEVNQLRVRVKALTNTVEDLRTRNASLVSRNEIDKITGQTTPEGAKPRDEAFDPLADAIKRYLEEIEELRTSLCESQRTNEQLRRQLSRMKQAAPSNLSGNILSSPVTNSNMSMSRSGFDMSMSSTTLREIGASTTSLSSTLTAMSTNNPRDTLDIDDWDNRPMSNLIDVSILDEAKADLDQLKNKSGQMNRRKVRSRKKKSSRGEVGGPEPAIDERDEDEPAGAGVVTSDYATDNNGQSTGEEDGLIASGNSEDRENSQERDESSLEEEYRESGEDDSGDEAEDDETETEEDEEEARYQQDLADLQTEISIKERLVEELQRSQQALSSARQRYEHQIKDLQQRIADTEAERDRVLADFEKKNSEKTKHKSDDMKKLKTDFESKINEMRSKLKQMQSMEREHQKFTRQQQQDQQRLLKLKTELAEMKKIKIELTKKMREESKRARELETKRTKEMGQMQREARKKDSKIKALEQKQVVQETMLKRKQEELALARKQQKMSSAVSRGNLNSTRGSTRDDISQLNSTRQSASIAVPVNRAVNRTPVRSKSAINPPGRTHQLRNSSARQSYFSSKAAKSKWNHLEKSLTSLIVKKQTSWQMEQDMNRLLKKRVQVNSEIETVTRKLTYASTEESTRELKDQLEDLKSELVYINDSIEEHQKSIIAVEDTKGGEDETESGLEVMVNACTNLEEAKYLLTHLVNMTIAQGVSAAEKTTELKEKEAMMKQMRRNLDVQENLLRFTIEGNPEFFGLDSGHSNQGTMSRSGDSVGSTHSTQHHPLFSQLSVGSNGDRTVSPDCLTGPKARRRTATTEELLYVKDRGAGSTPVTFRRSAMNPDDTPSSLMSSLIEEEPFESAERGRSKKSSDPEQQQSGSRTRDCSPNETLALPEIDENSSIHGSRASLLEKRAERAASAQATGGASIMDPGFIDNVRLRLNEMKHLTNEALTPPAEPTLSPSFPRKEISQPESGSQSARSSKTGGPPRMGVSSTASMPPPSTAPLPRRNISTSAINPGFGMTPGGSLHSSSSTTDLPERRSFNSRLKPNQSSSVLPVSTSDGPFSRGSAFRNTVAVPSSSRTSLNSSTDLENSFSRYMEASGSSSMSGSATIPMSAEDFGGFSPSSSPRLSRKMRNSSRSVFARLIPGGERSFKDLPRVKEGTIKRYEPRVGSKYDEMPLLCTHVVDGHHKAVLSVAVGGKYLVSGSKDRLAKVWDMEVGSEMLNLGVHTNNVQCVRILPEKRTVFTASMSQVKVWDLRSKLCVKTLNSSGLTVEGEPTPSTPSRQTTVPPNETIINAMEIGAQSDYLLTAGGNSVRIWDLRNFVAVGKLVNATHGTKSDVSSLTTLTMDKKSKTELVVTGSRDHYIKVYRLRPGAGMSGNIEPEMHLDPPHYDNVSCLAAVPNFQPGSHKPSPLLFSGSRDQNLMKWDLTSGERLHLEPRAHENWILALKALPSPLSHVLVSGGRNGVLKLWSMQNNARLGEITAHGSAINAIATSETHIFTASNDGQVGVWQPNRARLEHELRI